MIGTGDGNRPPIKEGCRIQAAETDSSMHAGTEELRLRVQQLSLREQIERNHFLLMRLNAASARLIQSIEAGDVFDAIRSEEHTSELQSRGHLVCRLLLEKKNKTKTNQ